MTFYEIDLYTSSLNRFNKEKYELDMKIQDSHNFNLGQYIGIATHDPQKYPRKPFSEKDTSLSTKDMTPEQFELSLRAWMGVLGGEEVTFDG